MTNFVTIKMSQFQPKANIDCHQCDQIGLFLKGIGDKFCYNKNVTISVTTTKAKF